MCGRERVDCGREGAFGDDRASALRALERGAKKLLSGLLPGFVLIVSGACGAKGDEATSREGPSTSGAFAEPCIDGEECHSELICARSGVAEGLCSELCDEDSECQVQFGQGARCEASACVQGCSDDDDCPDSSRCETSSSARRMPTPEEVVTSICPKQTSDPSSASYGYRPAVSAIVDRMKTELGDPCLSRELPIQDGKAQCLVIEASLDGTSCEATVARSDVDAALASQVRERLERIGDCSGDDCEIFRLCQIRQFEPGSQDYENCLSAEQPSGDGFCYIDPERGLGDPVQVERCPDTARRKLRFVGSGAPRKGAATFTACGS